MLKPNSLREHLTKAVPEFKRDPDKLTVFVTSGRLVTRGGATLSFEYRFTLEMVVLDYKGSPDAVMVPLLAWVKRNQVEIFENSDLREKAIRFEVEILNKDTIDMRVELDLTEAVIVAPGTAPTAPDAKRRYTITHLAEPAHVGVVSAPEHWEVVAGGEVLADWTFEPPQD
jgi:hypothetical protein